MSVRTVLLASLLLVPAVHVASAQLRSGSFVTCELSRDCTQETVDGRRFYVIQTPQLVVKVAIDADPKYNHIAVQLHNRSSYDIRFSPSDFRIEETQPKFKRLSYIEPGKLHLPRVKNARRSLPRPALGNTFMAEPPQESGSQPAGPVFLASSTLAPSGNASGEVFFERDKSNGGMTLLLPIAGLIYEFPYAPAK